MKRSAFLEFPPKRREFSRRAKGYLLKIQEQLMPAHQDEFIAIHVDSGEYVLGKTSREASKNFEHRWPDALMYLCRVDGGPAIKFHGH